jgi:hypothetical protein
MAIPKRFMILRTPYPVSLFWRRAVTTTSTPPQYTLRPGKSTEGGKVRRRQPSRPQQRLWRMENVSGRAAGPPRGLRS